MSGLEILYMVSGITAAALLAYLLHALLDAEEF